MHKAGSHEDRSTVTVKSQQTTTNQHFSPNQAGSHTVAVVSTSLNLHYIDVTSDYQLKLLMPWKQAGLSSVCMESTGCFLLLQKSSYKQILEVYDGFRAYSIASHNIINTKFTEDFFLFFGI